MRLIDADALIDIVKKARKKAKTLTGMDFVMVTQRQPTLDWVPNTPFMPACEHFEPKEDI